MNKITFKPVEKYEKSLINVCIYNAGQFYECIGQLIKNSSNVWMFDANIHWLYEAYELEAIAAKLRELNA